MKLSNQYRKVIKNHLHEKKVYPLYNDEYSKIFVEALMCHEANLNFEEKKLEDCAVMMRLMRFYEKRSVKMKKIDSVSSMSFHELMNKIKLNGNENKIFSEYGKYKSKSGIDNFLKTKTSKADLSIALNVIDEFRENESLIEWAITPKNNWEKLEQLRGFLENLIYSEIIN